MNGSFVYGFFDELTKIALIRGQPFRKGYSGTSETGTGEVTYPTPGGMATRSEIAKKLREARKPYRSLEHPHGGGRAESHGTLSELRTYAERMGRSGEDPYALEEHEYARGHAAAAKERTIEEAQAKEKAGKIRTVKFSSNPKPPVLSSQSPLRSNAAQSTLFRRGRKG